MNPWLLPLESDGDDGYTPPSVNDFTSDTPIIPGTPTQISKPSWQAVITALLVILLWQLVSCRLKVLPPERQFLAEYLCESVRNGIARDILHHDYRRFLPHLLGLFSFLLINNWFDGTFVFMPPTFSNVGFTCSLAFLSWCVYIGVRFRKLGIGSLRRALVPEGTPWYLLWLIVPLEFPATFVTRPVTLALHLSANMSAGHSVILTFVVGGSFLLTFQSNLMRNASGTISMMFSPAILFLELFIDASWTHIFIVLTTRYMSASVSEIR